ncbi:acyltransferase [Microbacterium sp.]|uniref:acyltransferase n=1 Tax=Microbacterium sp. TaxID=51671 RepID=UPI00273522F5|nr:acyltransferase [Microbacterium sp.]MDP3949401.1 acyltransferase [Microbacterium sp.]
MNDPRILPAGVRAVLFGKRVTIVEPVNLYECRIGDDTFIGPFVEVQANVRLGDRCRIQSHSFICELVSIGDDCFIGHGVCFINDTFSSGGPANGRKDLWSPCTIGDRVSIGSNATILPVQVCDDVVIGAGAVVTKDIKEPGVYAGNPAIRIG